MARIRSIKPEFFQHEELSQCSAHARLLAIALTQLCDANGVFRYVPMQIHAHAFPWEAEVNSPALLGELESVGYVKFFRAQGKDYGFLPGFTTHQRLTGKEAQSGGSFPTISQSEQQFSIGEATGKQSDASPGSIQMPRKEEQGTGNREQGITPSGHGQAVRETNPPDETGEKQLFDYGKRLLGAKGGGMVTKLRKRFRYDDAYVLDVLRQAEEKSDPREWLGAVLRGVETERTPEHILLPDDIYRYVQ